MKKYISKQNKNDKKQTQKKKYKLENNLSGDHHNYLKYIHIGCIFVIVKD